MDDILSLYALEAISEQDLETAYLVDCFEPRKDQENRKSKYGGFNLDELSEKECLTLFRFNKNDIQKLRSLLSIPETIETRQRYSVSGLTGLCVLLRRLAYPNRLSDLEPLFGLSSPYISSISNEVMRLIYTNKGHLLSDLNNITWLTEQRLELYAQSVLRRGSSIANCWGFIDGTPMSIYVDLH